MTKTTFVQAIEKFGSRTQAIKLNEEMAELAIEVTRWALDDSRADRKKILEEIIDVEIMLKQLKIIFDYSEDELIEMKVKKVAKLQMILDK